MSVKDPTAETGDQAPELLLQE